MCAQHVLDGVSQRTRRISVAAAASRKQNEPRVTATVGEALRGQWAKILDVVGHDRSLLACRCVKYVTVGSLRQVRTLAHRFDIEPPLTQDVRNLVR